MHGTIQEPTCPECDGSVRNHADESVCGQCGLVLGADRIDRGPEWRTFEDGPDRARTGAPLTRARHDRGLSTIIGTPGDDVELSPAKQRRIERLRREHRRSVIRSKRERNLVNGFAEIKRLAGVYRIPDAVRDGACSLFERAQEADLLRGRSLEGFAAAAVYAACRLAGLSRTIGEVLEHAAADEGELKAAYDALNRGLELSILPPEPAEFVPRYASDLGLEQPVERRALELATRAADDGVAIGRDPSGVAAACLYAAAGESAVECTQRTVADVAGVSPATVRAASDDLQAMIG